MGAVRFLAGFFAGAEVFFGEVFLTVDFLVDAGEDFERVAIPALYMTYVKLATRLCYNISMIKREWRKESIRTIVVDTAHLTDGTQLFEYSWAPPGQQTEPHMTAHLATIASTSPLMRGLHSATDDASRVTTPAAAGSTSVEWSAWHAGSQYDITVAGTIDRVLSLCDVTENEREQITLRARTLSRQRHIVFATARSTSDHAILPTSGLTFDGLVACSLVLLPGTTQALSSLRARQIRIVYITTEPEETAMLIAHAAGITTHPKSARHASFVTSVDHVVYAHADRINARRIIAALPQPLIVARRSLAELATRVEAYH